MTSASMIVIRSSGFNGKRFHGNKRKKFTDRQISMAFIHRWDPTKVLNRFRFINKQQGTFGVSIKAMYLHRITKYTKRRPILMRISRL